MKIALVGARIRCPFLPLAHPLRTSVPEYGTAVNAAAVRRRSQSASSPNARRTGGTWLSPWSIITDSVYLNEWTTRRRASMDIAVGKARAAATYRRLTRVFTDVINKGGVATATLPGVFASPGGGFADHGRRQGYWRSRREWRHRRPGDEQCAKAGLGT